MTYLRLFLEFFSLYTHSCVISLCNNSFCVTCAYLHIKYSSVIFC